MIKKAIIDSGVWISYVYTQTPYSEKATAIIAAFGKGEIKEVYITDYVWQEVVNFLIRKMPFEKVLEMYNFLIDHANVVFVGKEWEPRINELFRKYRALSITDCSILALAEREGINAVFSFDSGFDRVKTIQRMEDYSN